MMSDNVQTFLEASNTLNKKTLSLTRLQILTLLAFFDGLQYRELKSALRISDGNLISNLNLLKTMKYVDCSAVQIDNKNLDVYVLTKEGKDEIEKMTSWMKLAENLVQTATMVRGEIDE